MTTEEQHQPALPSDNATALQDILETDFGQWAPVEDYAHPLADEERSALQEELDAVEPAHAAAAARLHTLYAD